MAGFHPVGQASWSAAGHAAVAAFGVALLLTISRPACPPTCPAEASRSSSAFGGTQFWQALRAVDKLESEVRGLFAGENRGQGAGR